VDFLQSAVGGFSSSSTRISIQFTYGSFFILINYVLRKIYVAITVQETQFIATPRHRGAHNILLYTQSEQSRRTGNLTEIDTKYTMQTNIGRYCIIHSNPKTVAKYLYMFAI
jgi:hypothetical protein